MPLDRYYSKQRKPDPIQHNNSHEPFISPRARENTENSEGKASSFGAAPFFSPQQGIQAKLKMGQPNDMYEQEADKAADQVVKGTEGGANVQTMESDEEVQQKPLAAGLTPLVQKAEICGEEESVQKSEDEESIQAKGEAEVAPENSIEGDLNASKGRGSKMDGDVRNEMESGFGTDFSNVNIHTDERAAQMSQNIGAQAFTHGNDVYFNRGKYDPGSKGGKHLLAHELAHTVQQTGGKSKGPQSKGLMINQTPDPLQSDVSGVHFVKNPAQYASTRIAKLPKGTQLAIVDKASGSAFNKDLSDKSMEWWKVKVTKSSNKGLKGKTGWVMKKFLHGVFNNTVYYQGEDAGTISPSEINCLGHASGTKSTVAIYGPIEKTLKGLGYNCKAVSNGKSSAAPYIKKNKEVMMVYLYMYKSAWRDAGDQGLSYSALAKKYGWNQDSWKKDNVLWDASGASLPSDYHAINYNPVTKKWEWVGHNKPKKLSGGYDLDSSSGNSATNDPDSYWGSASQVLTKILCWK